MSNRDHIIKVRLDVTGVAQQHKQLMDKIENQEKKKNETSSQKAKRLEKEQQDRDTERYNLIQRRQVVDERNRVAAEKERLASIAREKKARIAAAKEVAKEEKLRNKPTLAQGARATNLDVSMEGTIDDLKRSRFGGEGDKDVDAQIARVRILRAQLKKVGNQRDLAKLARDYQKANGEIKKLIQSQNKYKRSLNATNPLIDKMGSSFKRMGLAGASAYTLIAGATKVFKVGMELDGMRASLLAASDGAEDAAENFEFLKKTAMDMGTPFRAGVTGFNRIGIAAKGMGVSVAQAQEVFKNITKATVASSLSAERTNLVYLALSQMMSKGKVSADELTRQMAEQMPFAMEAAQRATGKSAGEIFKLMEQGKLLSKDFVIPFTEAMGDLADRNGAYIAASKKVRAEMNRVGVAYESMIDDIFQDGGAGNFFGEMFRNITGLIQTAGPILKEFLKPLLSYAETAMFITRKVRELVGYLLKGSILMKGIKLAWVGIKAIFLGAELVLLRMLDTMYAVISLRDKLNPFSEDEGDSRSLVERTVAPSSGGVMGDLIRWGVTKTGGMKTDTRSTVVNIDKVVSDDPIDFMDKMSALESM